MLWQVARTPAANSNYILTYERYLLVSPKYKESLCERPTAPPPPPFGP